MDLSSTTHGRPTGAAFLLAQLGAHAARKFGERISPLGLTPPHAGILRMINSRPCSQQELAEQLGVFPSRIVTLIDELGSKGLVDRQRSTKDRRNYELTLTKKGRETLKALSQSAAEHESDLLGALNSEERMKLAALCRKIVEHQGLTRGVHPGFRDI